MARAREVIRQNGGAERCNTFSMFFLACLGQVPWRAVPAIPPELILLPRWFYFHLTKIQRLDSCDDRPAGDRGHLASHPSSHGVTGNR